MQKLWMFPSLAALLVSGALLTGCYAGTSGGVMVHSAPPAPQVAYYDYDDERIWIEGRWDWTANGWVWRDGYWIDSRPGYVYTQGYWDMRNGRYLWIDGRWLAQRPGYVWMHGYWGTRGGQHYWVRGSWTQARPGYRYTRGRWTTDRRGQRVWSRGNWVRDHRRSVGNGYSGAPPRRSNTRVPAVRGRDHRSIPRRSAPAPRSAPRPRAAPAPRTRDHRRP